ncbi:hypothetical protein JEQ12_012876 [Ovis aries]|uniref:Uncharacterized protein n=1 Tax=Ovis aries TaxID=9940 RepID=A0A835ZR37_SHEEP|nr:hypothetical protein JEQ12_012876 [Ovis aries]
MEIALGEEQSTGSNLQQDLKEESIQGSSRDCRQEPVHGAPCSISLHKGLEPHTSNRAQSGHRTVTLVVLFITAPTECSGHSWSECAGVRGGRCEGGGAGKPERRGRVLREGKLETESVPAAGRPGPGSGADTGFSLVVVNSGYSVVAVCGLLIAVASPCGAWGPECLFQLQ